jgi:hypothetical protein
MKKALGIFLNSVVATVLVMAILLWTHKFFLDKIELTIMEARGTSGYQGEEKGTEIWNIVFEIIIPLVFFIMLGVCTIFKLGVKSSQRKPNGHK